jgi:uncharacterized protein YggU (UPF0235/DUF167 family)
VTAAPDKGKANIAVLRLLSRTLDLAMADMALVAGATSRDKVVEIQGLEPHELIRRLLNHG